MEFGLIKSKIDKKLFESYKNDTFNKEIKNFKKLVLENKTLSKVFYFYDELSKEKGFEKSFAEDYLDECISLYKNIDTKSISLKEVSDWVKNIKSENLYEDIDTVLGKNTLVVENIIKSKSNIVNRLSTKPTEPEFINIPIENMVSVANQKMEEYLSNLSESEIKEISKYKSLSENELQIRYDALSEIVIGKLEKLTENSDTEIKEKINETIEKVKSEKVDSITLYKLKNLSENL
jgi:hypothetical protein